MQLYDLTSTSTYPQFTDSSPVVKNFLFIIPYELSDFENAVLEATTKRMSQFGYVYVADARQAMMEDRESVRYLPLRSGNLPHFGEVESVVVFHDESVAGIAAELYPGARFFVLNPGETSLLSAVENQANEVAPMAMAA